MRYGWHRHHQHPINSYSTSNHINTYVALVADVRGRYCHVSGTANTWHNYCDQLEELGCEVVEDQTDDYEIQDLGTIDDEIGVVPINKLLSSTDFIPN